MSFKDIKYQLNEIEQEKDIGVIINSRFTFDVNIKKKKNKAPQMLRIVINTFKFLDQQTFVHIGPLFFLVYIDGSEDNVASNILKFADDIKMFRRVQKRQECESECHTLQEDLNRLVQWSDKWQMLLNQSKCKCLHIGQANGK